MMKEETAALQKQACKVRMGVLTATHGAKAGHPGGSLSTTGLVPFASSFAMFAAGRAFEQVRNSIGYPHLNVKIGATHGGISVARTARPTSAVRTLL